MQPSNDKDVFVFLIQEKVVSNELVPVFGNNQQ
jgi:hypothetical protein